MKQKIETKCTIETTQRMETKRMMKRFDVLDKTLIFEVEFRTKRVVKKYECNPRKSGLSLMVLTFCEKNTYST